MEGNGASGETQAGEEGNSAASGTGDAGAGQGQETGQEAAQGTAGGAEGEAENNDEFGVGKDGDIPRERWNSAYSKFKEAEAERDQLKAVFETIQSDPSARQKFIESLKGESGGQEERPVKETPKAEQKPTALDTFLTQTPSLAGSPEHQALFKNFAHSIANDLEEYLGGNYLTKSEVEKMVAPLKRYVGDTETTRFFEKTPEAKTYQSKIVEMMRKHPSLSINEAFVLASQTDGKIRKAGEDKLKQKQEQLKKTPITGKAGTGGVQTKTPLPGGNQMIHEGVARAFAKLGIKD